MKKILRRTLTQIETGQENSAYKYLVILFLSTVFIVVLIVTSSYKYLKPIQIQSSTVEFNAINAHTDWLEQTKVILSGLKRTSKPEEIRAVREKIVLLRVAAEDRDVHLKLVLSLLAFERGERQAYEDLVSLINKK